MSRTPVEVGADGSVYAAGGTFNSGAGQPDALLLKFTSDGTLLWAVTWGGPSPEALADMAIGADGGVYLVGETSSFFWNDRVRRKVCAGRYAALAARLGDHGGCDPEFKRRLGRRHRQ
jgi:hypothetical protein